LIVRIRLARMDDLPAIMHTEDSCFGEERFDIGVVRAFLSRKDSFALVAVDGADVIGVAMCNCSERSARGRIASVAVLDDHRGKGLGSKLVRACEKEFRGRGITKFTLEAAVDNKPAVRTYISNGYVIKCIMKDYYSRGRGAYFMEKDVTMDGKRVKVKVS
jgi:ribosomal-protein-alanine N-acetyltransferase